MKYRIIEEGQYFYPQYKVWWWPFWNSVKRLGCGGMYSHYYDMEDAKKGIVKDIERREDYRKRALRDKMDRENRKIHPYP